MAASTACSGPTEVATPLFDSLHPPLVLVEEPAVSLPASGAANRLVQGWWDHVNRGEPQMTTVGNFSRLAGVHLNSRQRRLVVRSVTKPEAGGTVDVRIADRQWRTLPLTTKVRIPIPKNLETGRFTLDLRMGPDSAMSLRGLDFSDALPAGTVQVNGSDLVHSGWATAEVVRKLDGAERFSGTLRPPSGARTGQRFRLELETQNERRELAAWTQGEDPAREIPFAVEFGRELGIDPEDDDDHYARFRFVAEGEGPPAQWRDLTLNGSEADAPEPARAPKAPKLVVLYIMDALRADYLEHLGGPAGVSPTLDRLAAEGVTFANHWSVAPNTVPSMKSLLSGQKFLLKGGDKLTAASGPTLAEMFRDAGFRTSLFSGNGNVSPWRGMTRGYEMVSGQVLYTGQERRAAAGYNNNAEIIHDAALEWLDQIDASDRAFVHIQTIHPHNPYNPPEPFRGRFVPDNGSTINGSTGMLQSIRAQRVLLDDADRERLKGLYAASVAYNDAHLDRFLEAVLERYDPDEVLLLVTSDHGEELFEHGGVLHGYTLYDEMLKIPLVAWWPETIPAAKIDALTDNVDLHATLAELARGSGAEPAQAGGSSLWPYLLDRAETATPKEVLFASASAIKGGIFMARSERYKVVYAPRGSSRGGSRWGMGQGLGRGWDVEYTFDLVSDPAERVNLAGETELETDWLRQQLAAWIEVGTRLEAGEALDEMDDATRESLRALGYLQ